MYATRHRRHHHLWRGPVAQSRRPHDGTLDEAAVDRALADATDEVEMSLRGRYRLPLSPVPQIVRRWVIDIALAMLPTSGAGDSDLLTDRAKAARQALKDLRSGATVLDLPAEAPAARGGAGHVAFDGPGQVFTPNALKSF